MLLDRKRERFRMTRALFWAVSWGVGAGIGVALGGWLTLVGGSGAPGTEGLDPISDLVVLPALAFVVVVFVHLGGQIVAAALRGRAEAGGKHQHEDQGGEEHDIAR